MCVSSEIIYLHLESFYLTIGSRQKVLISKICDSWANLEKKEKTKEI